MRKARIFKAGHHPCSSLAGSLLAACTLSFLGLLAMAEHQAHADMGTVSYEPEVRVFEPRQRALIAWNGSEEILILSTDLKVSAPTKVLEVMPFPSRPTVKAGTTKTFEKAVKLINAAQKPRAVEEHGAGTFGEEGDGKAVVAKMPAAELTFHKKIGATDINVVHVLKKEGFVDWVEKHLKSQGVRKVEIPEIMRKSVQEYLDDGCQWFAFNVVSLGKEVRSKEAVEYRFKSKCLYYPLRISRTNKGDTEISLLVLTTKMINNRLFASLPRKHVTLEGDPARISRKELDDLHPEINRLLGRPQSAMLRVWSIEGELGSFDRDLVAGVPPCFKLVEPRSGRESGPVELREGATIRIGNATYTVKPYPPAKDPKANSRFALTSRNRYVGKCVLEDGAEIKIGTLSLTLKTVKPKIGGPAAGSRSKEADDGENK